MNIFHKFRSGFTIVEALIAVSISIILTSTLIVYSRESEKQIAFFREESLLIGNILRAKSFAIETFQPGFRPSPGSAPSASPTEKICGWGIHFNKDKNEYVFFKDRVELGGACDQNPSYDASQDSPETFEKFLLDSRLAIKCIEFTDNSVCTGARLAADAIFIPPDPRVAFSPATSAAKLLVQIEIRGSNRTATVSITKAGQVNISTP